jgi:hypothetical protein
MVTKRTTAQRKPASTEGILQPHPRYKVNQGPLTQGQMDAIDRLQPAGRMKVKKSLF